ncbi:hypothetical protein HZA73_01330 [candidate division TA06 bacterium]|nr:hypothetical protein [candidate division TA06 bacterium]
MKSILLILFFVLAILTGQTIAQSAGSDVPVSLSYADLASAGTIPVKPAEDVFSRRDENAANYQAQSQKPVAAIVGIQPEALKNETVILFRVNGATGSETAVRLCIFDPAGCEVAVLVDDLLEPDSYQVRWDGRDGSERLVSNGLYFTRLSAAGLVVTQKMTVDR